MKNDPPPKRHPPFSFLLSRGLEGGGSFFQKHKLVLVNVAKNATLLVLNSTLVEFLNHILSHFYKKGRGPKVAVNAITVIKTSKNLF